MVAPGPAIQVKPIEIQVTHSFEEALKKFKQLVQNENILSDLKKREHHEKPSVKKRRKSREAEELRLLTDLKNKMIESGEWEKRKRKKDRKKQEKAEARIKRQESFELNP